MIKPLIACAFVVGFSNSYAQEVATCPPGHEAYCEAIRYHAVRSNREIEYARKMVEVDYQFYEKHPDAQHKAMLDEDLAKLNAAVARQ